MDAGVSATIAQTCLLALLVARRDDSLGRGLKGRAAAAMDAGVAAAIAQTYLLALLVARRDGSLGRGLEDLAAASMDAGVAATIAQTDLLALLIARGHSSLHGSGEATSDVSGVAVPELATHTRRGHHLVNEVVFEIFSGVDNHPARFHLGLSAEIHKAAHLAADFNRCLRGEVAKLEKLRIRRDKFAAIFAGGHREVSGCGLGHGGRSECEGGDDDQLHHHWDLWML